MATTHSGIPPELLLDVNSVLNAIAEELGRAHTAFPSPAGCMCALTEEVGELAKALLDEPRDRVRAEAVQVAVMAIRIATEGDPTLDAIRRERRADA